MFEFRHRYIDDWTIFGKYILQHFQSVSCGALSHFAHVLTHSHECVRKSVWGTFSGVRCAIFVGLYRTLRPLRKSGAFSKSGLSRNRTFSFPDAGLLKLLKIKKNKNFKKFFQIFFVCFLFLKEKKFIEILLFGM